jgi:hypothetical protein
MHKQYLANEEDIEFPKVSSVKQLSGISLELNTGKLEILPQFHLGSNLVKECSIVFYNPCARICEKCIFKVAKCYGRICEKWSEICVV